MDIHLLKNSAWGGLLWFIGYVLGIILFPFVQINQIGWFITPVGVLLTFYILLKRVSAKTMMDYLIISVIWTLIAVILDYLLLVQLFKPEDGYYKFDVYLYYAVTFLMPIVFGIWKRRKIS